MAASSPERHVGGEFTRFRSGVHRLNLFPFGARPALEFMARHAQPFVVLTAVHYLIWDTPDRVERGIADLARVRRWIHR